MYGLQSNTVYDLATLLADQMDEFITLQHRTFYMPHYPIGFFLKATRTQIPVEELQVMQQGRMEATHPPILYWHHLDTLATSGISQSSSKRK